MTAKLFTQPNCPPCLQVKAYLKSKNILYEELDREANAKEMMTLSGVISTPVLVTDKGVAIGLNYGKINAITA